MAQALEANPALGQQIFDIAKTQREAEAQSNRVADDFGWKAVTLEGNSREWGPLRPKSGRSRDHVTLD